MNSGWVKFHRSILDNPRSSDPDWFSVWGHLLLMATHKEMKFIFKGAAILLKPGQLITSRDSLSKKTGVNTSKIERVLKWMQIEQQIEQESSSVSRLITILNWDRYQSIEQVSEHESDTKRTPNEHQTDTNKNVKKDKNVRSKIVVEANGSLQPADQQWLEDLIKDSAYHGLDVPREFRKCLNWCNAKKVAISRRRFINWLNKAEAPLSAKVLQTQPDWFRDVRDKSTTISREGFL